MGREVVLYYTLFLHILNAYLRTVHIGINHILQSTYRASLVEILQTSACVANPRIHVEAEYPHGQSQVNPARPNHHGTISLPPTHSSKHPHIRTSRKQHTRRLPSL